MKKFTELEDVKAIRKETRLNQSDFWNAVGVTQSGGSRYESGRKMPNAVRELVRVVYVEGVSLESINKGDLDVAKTLKQTDPSLYKELKKQAKEAEKN